MMREGTVGNASLLIKLRIFSASVNDNASYYKILIFISIIQFLKTQPS